MAASSAAQLPHIFDGRFTSQANCDLEQIEAETPRHVHHHNTRLALTSHMPEHVFPSQIENLVCFDVAGNG